MGEGTDLAWYRPDGEEVAGQEWDSGHIRALSVLLGGDGFEVGPRGEAIVDDDFLWFVNASDETIDFAVPPPLRTGSWAMVLDTTAGTVHLGESHEVDDPATVTLGGRSQLLLMRRRDV